MRSLYIVLLATISISAFSQTTFQSFQVSKLANGDFRELAPADYDSDGDIDFVAIGDATVLMKNNGGKNFSHVAVPSLSGGDLEWADIDNDNDLDLITVNALYVNEGNDIFKGVVTGMVGSANVSTSDFNNDGRIDVVLRKDGDFFFYRNLGNYTFTPLPKADIDFSVDLAWADFNTDGYPDFASGRKLYRNNGDETFTAIDLGFVNNGGSTYLWADLDNDNDLDFVRHANAYTTSSNNTTYTNTLKVYENQGNSVFVDKGSLTGVVSMATPPVSADFDNDGDVDVLINGTKTSDQYSGYETRIYWNNGNFTFTGENINEGLTYRYIMKAADLDNDLDADLVLGSVFLSTQRGLENKATATASRPVAPVLSTPAQSGDDLTLSWAAAQDAESGQLSYNLYVKRDDVFFITPQANIASGWPMVPGYANMEMLLQKTIDTGAWPEGFYTWGVQAVDHEMNASPFSTEGTFEIRRNVLSTTPSGLNVAAVASNSVSLQWTDLSSDESAFDLERSSTSGNTGFQVIASLPANTVSYIDNTVQTNQAYYYRIRLAGSAATSNVIMAPTPSALPVAPSNLSVTTSSTTQMGIAWQYSPADNNGFVVERSKTDLQHFMPVATLPASARSFSDGDLNSGTVYFYRVYATSAAGRSQHSEALKTSTIEQLLVKKALPSYLYEFSGSNISWADYDNDGFDDVFIPYKSQLLKNNGDGTFTAVLDHGISLDAPATSYPISVWGDYNNDGYADLFMGNENGVNKIFKNNGNGTFKGIISQVTLDVPFLRSATWVDIDNDGDLELAVCGDYYRAYFRYDGGDVFTKVELPKSENQNGFKFAAWGDVNDDGYVDAYFGIAGRDQLMMNDKGVFKPVSSPLLASSDYGSMFAIWSDFNNDLKLDLTALHDAEDYIFASTATGHEIKYTFGWYPYSLGGNTVWVDFDNDGDLDFFSSPGNAYGSWYYENTGNGELVQKLSAPLNEVLHDLNAVSWVDYNYDGFVDGMPLGTNTNIYENKPNGNAWVRLRLQGKQSNSKGLGAKIFVKANGKWQRRDIHTGHSVQVQQGFDVIVGLGTASKVDSIKVKWPSGAVQYLVDQGASRLIVIREEDAQVKAFGNPSNLRGTTTNLSSIRLMWQDNSADEETFIIQRSSDGLTFSDVASVAANTTAFTVTGLSMDNHQTFRVVARKGTTTSLPTNTFTGKIDLFQEVNAGYLSRTDAETSGGSWMDFTMDGKQDLFLSARSFEGDAVYRNTGEQYFTRETMPGAQLISGLTRAGAWGDYNNDGFPDLFLSVGGGYGASQEYLNDQLWKNVNGVLTKQTADVVAKDGIASWHAAWGDLNKDGYLDLVVGTDRQQLLKYVNLGGQSFSQMANVVTYSLQRLMLADIDNDNDLDLVSGALRYLNTGGNFAPPTGGIPAGSGSNFVIEDIDEDGRLDLLVAGSLNYFKYDLASNAFVLQPNPFPGRVEETYSDVNVADLDNNGHLDVVAVRGGKPEIYLNAGQMTFTKFTSQSLHALNVGTALSAIADFNNDGTLDIFFSAGSSVKKVLVKTADIGNHWLRVKLKGIQSPRDGIGAKIKVITKNAFQMREVRSSRGALSSNEQIAHFGLGDNTTIDYLKIEWPSGNSQWIKNPSIDNLLVVEETDNAGPDIPAPSALTATMSTEGKISLSWNDPWDMEHGFVVERSVGSETNFKTIAEVPANTVAFNDPGEYSATVRYRIRTYFDNRSSAPGNVAEVVITSIEYRNDGIEVYPNPAADLLTIRSALPVKSIQLLDSRGVLMLQEVPEPGLTEHKLSLSSVVPGIYMIRLKLASGILTRKLAIAR